MYSIFIAYGHVSDKQVFFPILPLQAKKTYLVGPLLPEDNFNGLEQNINIQPV